jgi:hypothetical protein
MINVRIQKKLDSSATSLLSKDSNALELYLCARYAGISSHSHFGHLGSSPFWKGRIFR